MPEWYCRGRIDGHTLLSAPMSCLFTYGRNAKLILEAAVEVDAAVAGSTDLLLDEGTSTKSLRQAFDASSKECRTVQKCTPRRPRCPLPENLAVSCSWLSGNPRTVIGECWVAEAPSRGYFEVFISPVPDQVAGIQGVLATMRHELVHPA